MAATGREQVKEGAWWVSPPPEATIFQRIKTPRGPLCHGVICEKDLDMDLGNG